MASHDVDAWLERTLERNEALGFARKLDDPARLRVVASVLTDAARRAEEHPQATA